MLKKLPMILLTAILALQNAAASTSTKDKPLHTCTKKDSTTLILACSMYAEARGEGEKGMLMVGNVILNRKNHEDYPSKIKKVVYQKNQFSYLTGSPVRVYEKDTWNKAKNLAKFLILLENEDPSLRVLHDRTKGAIFYVKKGTRVAWLKSMKKVASYKDHDFYVPKSDT